LPIGGRQMIEQVVLSSGRPVLVVPYIGWTKTLGERITIAWDGGRESARAVADALPLLKKAKAVTVLVINPEKGNHGEEPGADIALHLARHGVNAEVRRARFDDVDTGNAILSQVADLSSDLLVMGAYGHSRLRELVIGGVTRTIFEEMTVPVLMSH
jgi:nucleotide-binding universal stress UspA family protein